MDKQTRETLGAIIEQLIAIVDVLDGDPDLEDEGLSEEVSDEDVNPPNLWIDHAKVRSIRRSPAARRA